MDLGPRAHACTRLRLTLGPEERLEVLGDAPAVAGLLVPVQQRLAGDALRGRRFELVADLRVLRCGEPRRRRGVHRIRLSRVAEDGILADPIFALRVASPDSIK